LPRGLPDYQRYVAVWKYAPADIFGRRLNLIFADDFASTLLKWSGTGVRVTDTAFYGGACVKFSVPATETGTRQLSRFFGIPPEEVITVRHVWYHNYTWKWRYSLTFEAFIAGYDLYGEVRYLRDEKKWQYVDKNGDHVDIPDGDQYLVEKAWHRLELTVDLHKRQYVQMVSDNLVLDLKGKDLYVPTTSELVGAYVQLYFDAYDVSGTIDRIVYVDGVEVFAERRV